MNKLISAVSPHFSTKRDTTHIMLDVILALCPAADPVHRCRRNDSGPAQYRKKAPYPEAARAACRCMSSIYNSLGVSPASIGGGNIKYDSVAGDNPRLSCSLRRALNVRWTFV
jgi:hypothetical protein